MPPEFKVWVPEPSKVTVPVAAVNAPEFAQLPPTVIFLSASVSSAERVWLASIVMLSALRLSCRVKVVAVVLADTCMLPMSMAFEVNCWLAVPALNLIRPETCLVNVGEPETVISPAIDMVPVLWVMVPELSVNPPVNV